MTWIWIDPRGQRHNLTHYQPIIDEAEATSREIDDLVALADGNDPIIRTKARDAIRTAHARLERLRDDLERWNRHADIETQYAATELVAAIDALPAEIVDVTLVVALHDEQDNLIERTGGDLDARKAALAAPMTTAQRSAIAAPGSRTPPPETATRAEAKAWLDGHPRFARGRGNDGGWFAWTDRHGHAHRIADPLPIEREVSAVATDLARARDTLTTAVEPDGLYAAVNEARALMERLTNLKYDLERFDLAESAREDAAWKSYAADWRSKRKMT